MSIRKKGNTNIRIVNIETVADPESGIQTLVTFEGLRDPLAVMAAQLSGGKVPVRMNRVAGPWYSMTVVFAGAFGKPSGLAAQAVDTWSRTVEFAQEDIRSNPLVIASFGTTWELNLAVKDIVEKVRDGVEIVFTDPVKQKLFELFSRGGEAHEVKRILLRRRRTIPVNYATPAEVAAVESVYTSARLIAAYNIPQSVAARLMPSTPNNAPSNTVWAWKERANTSDFVPSTGKVDEVLEWTFAAWSTLLYNVLS